MANKITRRHAAMAVLCIFSLRSPQFADGETRTEYSLDELLRVASKTNPTLETAYFQRDAAEGSSKSTKGADDFVVGAAVNYSSSRAPIINGNPIQQTASENISASASLSRSLPTGGQASLTVSGSDISERYQNLSVANSDPFLAERSTGQISAKLSHSLLRGAGTSIARSAQKTAALQLTAAELTVREEAIASIQEVSNAYWSLVLAHQLVKVRKQAVEDGKDELKASRISIRAGSLPPNSQRVVEQRIAVRQQEVTSAQLTLAESSLFLRGLVGLEIGPDDVYIDPKDPLTAEDRSFNTRDALAAGLKNNPGLAKARIQLKTANISRKVADDSTLPLLDGSLSGDLLGVSDSLGSAASAIGKVNNYRIEAQLTFQYDILNRTGAGSAEAANARSEIAKITLRQSERNLSSQIIMAIYTTRGTFKNIGVGKTAVALAEKNLKSERTKFRAGRSSLFQVLERQDELRDARLSLAQTITDHRRAVVSVDALTGDLLERSGIDFVDE